MLHKKEAERPSESERGRGGWAMKWFHVIVANGIVLTMMFASAMAGEAEKFEPPPKLWQARPAGAKAGTTVEVVVIGKDLGTPQGLVFSEPEVKGEPIGRGPSVPSPTGPDVRRLGNRLESWKFRVVVPENVPLGRMDVRVVNAGGISNPRAFTIGDLAEAVETEPNDDLPQAQKIELNSTIHGAIERPNDVDEYRFRGEKGTRVIASCETTGVDARLTAALELFDLKRRPLATNHEYREGDALLVAVLPEDGDYVLRVHDFTYTRGGIESFYRLSLATTPWIDSVVPSAAVPGSATKVTVFGRNLPGGAADPSFSDDEPPLERCETTLNAPSEPGEVRDWTPPRVAEGPPGFEFRLSNDAGSSNPFRLILADQPLVTDEGQNDRAESAMKVEVPCEIAGRFEARGDKDWYEFAAKSGETYSIEAFGDRLGAPVDLYLNVYEAESGRSLGELDDPQGGGNRFDARWFSQTLDPVRFRLVARKSGRYRVLIASRESTANFGPRHSYVLRIAPERGDFALTTMPGAEEKPDSTVIRRGGRASLLVHARRIDGFSGPIALSAEGLPKGVVCPPSQTIGPSETTAELALEAGEDALESWVGPIRVIGRAKIDDRQVVRRARSATVTWGAAQPNFPTLSRLDHANLAAVRSSPAFRIDAEIATATIAPGQTLTVPFRIVRLRPDFKGPIQIHPPDPLRTNRGAVPQPLTTLSGDQKEGRATLKFPRAFAPGTHSLVLHARCRYDGGQAMRRGQAEIYDTVSAPIVLTIDPKAKTDSRAAKKTK